MIVTIRQLDYENRVIKSCETSSQSIKLVNLWSNFKVDSRTTGFDQIRLIREVLSGFWVLVSILRYFYYFEAFRGTFVTLEVYGYFGYFLALMVYFSHFGWSNCVHRVQQHMFIMQPDGDSKFDRWIDRMW